MEIAQDMSWFKKQAKNQAKQNQPTPNNNKNLTNCSWGHKHRACLACYKLFTLPTHLATSSQIYGTHVMNISNSKLKAVTTYATPKGFFQPHLLEKSSP